MTAAPDPDEAETDCGHDLVRMVVDGAEVVAHHEIPDDGAPHVPAGECGCGPELLRPGGGWLFLHPAQAEMGYDD